MTPTWLPAPFGIACTALSGVVVYLVARQIWPTRRPAVLAAGLQVTTPGFVHYSRIEPRFVVAVAIVLLWLWCVLAFERNGRRPALVAGAILLGAGCYISKPSMIMMPIYLVVSVIVAARRRGATGWWFPLAVIAAFGAVVAGGVLRVVHHREVYVHAVQAIGLYDASRLTPLQGLKDVLNYNNVQERISVYWDYYDPGYLFLASGLDPAAPHTGVLLLATGICLPLGLCALLRERTETGFVLLAGFATAAVAAVLVDERYVVRRELFIVPFAVLISVAGVEHLLGSPRPKLRLAARMLVALAGAQAIGVALGFA